MKDLLKNKNIRIVGIIAVVVIILLASSIRIVESGEVGVRVRFGKASNQPTHEGINLKIPFIEQIKKMNIRVQKIEVTTSSSSKD